MKKIKGFTLVELVIVIVIVAILSIVAVPIYRGYVRRSIATEGKTLLGSILTAEKVYLAEFANYKVLDETTLDEELEIDTRANKYFTSFAISTLDGGESFEATITGQGTASGITMILQAGKSTAPTWTDSGLND
jgi:type IV pilus assembly protein PilE